MKIIITLIFILMINPSFGEFFQDISASIKNNQKRLSYGVSVTDFNKDGKFEFIVTGFKFPNLILSHKNGYLENINTNNLFADQTRSTIGVAACDIDNDGFLTKGFSCITCTSMHSWYGVWETTGTKTTPSSWAVLILG